MSGETDARVQDAVARHVARWTEAARDIEVYMVDQVFDASHREIVGPVFPARGGSGVVHVGGREVARWGDPTVPEMAFSATKSALSAVAGVAYDAGLLDPAARVSDVLDLPEFEGRPLGTVLREALLGPLGATTTWAWHGYRGAEVEVDGVPVPVVSGGAHWGGGLVISAADFALLGGLYLDRGVGDGRRLLSAAWIERSWTPCPVKPEYGYLW